MACASGFEGSVPTSISLAVSPCPRATVKNSHVHVMARQIQANQALTQKGVFGPRAAKETQKTAGGAAVRHHVQNRPKLCALVECPGCEPIKRVEETADGVGGEAG